MASKHVEDAKRKRRSSSLPLRHTPRSGTNGSVPLLCSSPLQKRRKKWARLLLRELYDLGFQEAAAALEREACIQLQSPAMKRLHELIRTRQWDKSLQLVMKKEEDKDEEEEGDEHQVEMKSPEATREATLLLLQRKYIDHLLAKQLSLALRTFQEEILSVCKPSETEVKQLAGLLLCRDADEVKQRATLPWQDDELWKRMEKLLSPEEFIPKGALRGLVQNKPGIDLHVPRPELRGRIVGECVKYLTTNRYSDVWELAFSPDGNVLASASSDGSIVLWQLKWSDETSSSSQTLQCLAEARHVLLSLEGPADCLAWSPDSKFLLSSGSRSKIIQLWDPMSGECEKEFHHPGGVVTKTQWLPCGKKFISGSADKSLAVWNASEDSTAYQWSGPRVIDSAVHPYQSKVFVLISSIEIRVFNTSLNSDELFFQGEDLISCISLSSCGKYLLVNYFQREQIACIETATGSLIAKYDGIREQRYVLRPCFTGTYNELVACGSEDGLIYLWTRDSGKQIGELDGHSSVVNVVVRHPIHSNVIASASDDKTVLLWSLKSYE
ncbi:hypothetical protein PsorP6_009589 [Peronosclerospora sorghi]|uniref:Uncharacterized protein n=1 Tax=Peronosclerospora sorghi TaxID=230839 RepID=A0ACC0W0H7_9STRA|nr:hypothetical protein PsorP6_009589 [Peronosclerospora sorghi]